MVAVWEVKKNEVRVTYLHLFIFNEFIAFFSSHIFLSPNPVDTYAALHFAPLVNLADSLDKAATDDERSHWKTEIEKHVAVLTFMTEQAAASVQDNFLL